jgi:hypothetical protein
MEASIKPVTQSELPPDPGDVRGVGQEGKCPVRSVAPLVHAISGGQRLLAVARSRPVFYNPVFR